MKNIDSTPVFKFFSRHGIEVHEIELGPETPSHIGYPKLSFGIFDGFALTVQVKATAYNQPLPECRFIKLTYPTLNEIKECEYYRDSIRRYRFAGRIETRCQVFADDSAICFGKAHEVTLADFEESLKTGLAQIGKKPTHLHIYRNEPEFLAAMDGKIYCIVDTAGKWLCDLHVNQFISLTDEEKVVDTCGNFDYPLPTGAESDYILTHEMCRQTVYDRRIEIINLYK